MKNPFRSIRIFWGEMIHELKRASWPTRTELRDSTIVVLVGVAMLGVFISVADFALVNWIQFFTTILR